MSAQSQAQRYSPRPLTAGERWTADTLTLLRRGNYRPRAWARFLRSALRRSRESASALPEMSRQARVWGVVGALAWVAACASPRLRRHARPRLFRGLLWWLSVWQMLDWHLAMAEGGDGRVRSRLSRADAVTLGRFWLVPATWATARCARALPTVIVIGGLTDWLDGRLARARGRTRLGRDLDTTADLLFLTNAALAARSAGRISPLAFGVLAARQGVGLAIALGAVFARARRPAIRARPWGAALRIGGLTLCTVGARRLGTAMLIAGSVVPPRSTAPHLSRA